jgi:enamine deaminase RidA (YjgF/YER057c/UK114 family)
MKDALENDLKNRRSFFKKAGAFLASFGFGSAAVAGASPAREAGGIVMQDDVPLFSGHTIHNGLVYIAGKGAHFEGDIKAHTNHVLNEVQRELEEAGSSMDNVLKVNVYLHDINDYDGMNEVYRGRFGDSPPVRTTVATFGGVPGDSLVEIDCIASL